MDEDTHLKAQRRRRTSRVHDAMNTPNGREFNIIVHQAAAALGTRMALMSLLDEDRRWFGARVGIDLPETPVTFSLCLHAIPGAGVLVVPDATRDARLAANPLVTGRPHIRFYAGAALQVDGVRVGALCVLDDQPRHAVSPLQEQYLTYLADRTAAAVAARRRG